MNPSLKDRFYNWKETKKHVWWVRWYMLHAVAALLKRAYEHDASKFGPKEAPFFASAVRKLAGTPYGTQEYKDLLNSIKPAVKHHQSNNTHHPEYHYPESSAWNCTLYQAMPLLDQIEMLCDWKAAGRRHNTGSLMKSIEVNKDRFKLTDYEVQSLYDTAYELGILDLLDLPKK